MKLSYKEISETAKAFHKAGEEVESIFAMLDKRMQSLQKNWSEMQEQDFYSVYKEWHLQTQGLVQMLNTIGRDMEAIVKRYRNIDK